MSSPGALVLVIEDEPQMRRFLRASLTSHGFQVVEASEAKEGIALATSHNPEIILLDLGLPDADGMALTRELRGWARMPIIVISARGREADKVEALDSGADDYLTKPFGLRELMSRIKALLRRAYGDLSDAAGGRVIRHGDLVIDLERRRVQRGDRRISLTPTEFEILRHLASRPGRVYTRSELLELLRDYEALDQAHDAGVQAPAWPPIREATPLDRYRIKRGRDGEVLTCIEAPTVTIRIKHGFCVTASALWRLRSASTLVFKELKSPLMVLFS